MVTGYSGHLTTSMLLIGVTGTTAGIAAKHFRVRELSHMHTLLVELLVI